MKKATIFLSVLAILFAGSCKKDDKVSLPGTQWGTTIRQPGGNYEVLLSFTNDTKGTLTVTGTEPVSLEFTYTFKDPNVTMHPVDNEWKEQFPSGIKAKVSGKVMDFSDFFAGQGLPEVTLTKK